MSTFQTSGNLLFRSHLCECKPHSIRELFELYAKCKDSSEVIQVQNEYLAKLELEKEAKGYCLETEEGIGLCAQYSSL
jgi:hypothetical protein